jgi:hypothetical protein
MKHEARLSQRQARAYWANLIHAQNEHASLQSPLIRKNYHVCYCHKWNIQTQIENYWFQKRVTSIQFVKMYMHR